MNLYPFFSFEEEPDADGLSDLLLIALSICMVVFLKIVLTESESNGQNSTVNNMADQGTEVVDIRDLATLQISEGRKTIVQNGMVWRIPEEIDRFLEQAIFLTDAETGTRYLLFEVPGAAVDAKSYIEAIQALNNQGIEVRTREVVYEA